MYQRRHRGALVAFALLVAAGLLSMHTLGRPDADCHGGVLRAPMTSMVGGTHLPAGGSGAHATVTRALTDLTARHGVLDPMLLCLAILCAATLVVAVVLACRGVRRGHLMPPLPAMLPGLAGRGPPPRPHGLLLADLSVLRN